MINNKYSLSSHSLDDRLRKYFVEILISFFLGLLFVISSSAWSLMNQSDGAFFKIYFHCSNRIISSWLVRLNRRDWIYANKITSKNVISNFPCEYSPLDNDEKEIVLFLSLSLSLSHKVRSRFLIPPMKIYNETRKERKILKLFDCCKIERKLHSDGWRRNERKANIWLEF